MSVVAIYSMKGGVGKTTTAVNLAYQSARAGQRTLLWDLDPQAAATFAFRIRARVDGFGRKTLKDGHALAAAIRETDYERLDVLPADFAYRKIDRFLDRIGEPASALTDVFSVLHTGYDLIVLDCPPGFSLLSEGILGSVDCVVVPAIPTVLSLRTLSRIIKRAARSDSRADLAVFLNMVDRRKALHRRACEACTDQSDLFLRAQIPYASVVEQMGTRRMPLAAFAPSDAASQAFDELWKELDSRIGGAASVPRPSWDDRLRTVDALVEELEFNDTTGLRARLSAAIGVAAAHVIHRFDTDARHLERAGCHLQLHERGGRLAITVARDATDAKTRTQPPVEVQVDRSWAIDLLAGTMSPFDALDRRLGRPSPSPIDHLRAITRGQTLVRIESLMETGASESDAGGSRILAFDPTRAERKRALAG